jgi:hypothetical protein
MVSEREIEVAGQPDLLIKLKEAAKEIRAASFIFSEIIY